MEKIVAHIVSGLKKDKSVLAVLLFGSHAKGKANPMSDIDLAVVLQPYSSKSAIESSAMSSRFVDTVVFNNLPPYVKFEVIKHSKVLFCRSKKRLASAFADALREYHYHIPLYEKFIKVKQ